MVFFRWFFGLPVAGLITGILFLVMAGLIHQPEVNLMPPKPPPNVKVTAQQEPIAPNATERRRIPEKAPPETKMNFPAAKNPKGVPYTPPTGTTASTTIDTGSLNVAPMISYPPAYPEACRTRGIEGVVVVQFDVTPEGNVVNVQIVQAPDRCFNRIISTIAKWKYPPAMRNGRPSMRYGVREQFSFELV